MQIINNKIILALIISIFVVQNIYGEGKRKNFLSHGPSVSAFSQGETTLNSLEIKTLSFTAPIEVIPTMKILVLIPKFFSPITHETLL